MRSVLIALAMILLLGCAQQAPAENATPAGHAPANVTVKPAPNATFPPQNTTQPVQNASQNGSGPQNASGSPIHEGSIPSGNSSAGSPADSGNATSPNATNAGSANATHPPLRFDNYSLVLEDASIVTWSSAPCGIFSVDAANGSTMSQFVLCPGQSRSWMAPDGRLYRVFVVKVAAGYGGVYWADVIVFG